MAPDGQISAKLSATRLARAGLDQTRALTTGVGVVLGVLVLVPLVVLFATSLQVGTTLGFPPAALSLERYQDVYPTKLQIGKSLRVPSKHSSET